MIKQTLACAALALLVAGPVQSAEKEYDAGGAQEYVDKVEKRRQKYGNEDGLRHSRLVNGNHFSFTLGMMNWISEPLGSGVAANGPAFGIDYVYSFSDYVGVNAWGGYGSASYKAGASVAGFGASVESSVSRIDYGIGLRVQSVIPLSSAGAGIVPYLNLGPAYSSVQSHVESVAGSVVTKVDSNEGSLGFSVAPGIEWVFGAANIGFKFNYLVSQSLATGNANTSAVTPQLTAGWAF